LTKSSGGLSVLHHLTALEKFDVDYSTPPSYQQSKHSSPLETLTPPPFTSVLKEPSASSSSSSSSPSISSSGASSSSSEASSSSSEASSSSSEASSSSSEASSSSISDVELDYQLFSRAVSHSGFPSVVSLQPKEFAYKEAVGVAFAYFIIVNENRSGEIVLNEEDEKNFVIKLLDKEKASGSKLSPSQFYKRQMELLRSLSSVAIRRNYQLFSALRPRTSVNDDFVVCF
jgi:hypothetical protein